MNESNTDYYALLGVPKNATPAAIRAAYREKILRHHPDKSGHTDMCNLLSKAQEILLDAHKREVYDNNGREGLEYMEARRLANKDTSVTKVKDKMAQREIDKHKQWFHKNVGAKGLIELYSTPRSLLDVLSGRQRLYSIGKFTTSQSFSYPLDHNNRLRVSTFVVTNPVMQDRGYEQLSVHPGVHMKYTHERNEDTSFTSMITLSEGTSLIVGAATRVDEHMKGNIALSMKSDMSFPSLQVGLSRRLYVPVLCPYDTCTPFTGAWKNRNAETPLVGHAMWNLGPSPSLYLGSQYYSRLVKLVLSATAFSGLLSLGINLELLLTKGAHIVMGGRYGFGGNSAYRVIPAFSLGSSSQLTRHTSLSLITQLDTNGVSFVPTISRWGYTVRLPMLLSAFTSIPWIMTAVLGSLLFNIAIFFPMKMKVQREKAEKRRAKIEADKIQAEEYLQSMSNTIRIQFEVEKNKHPQGLIICYASYGRLTKRKSFIGPASLQVPLWYTNGSLEEWEDEEDPEIVDVTNALQLLVNNSQLSISPSSKSLIPGFYDPSGKDNYLEVYYTYMDRRHRRVIRDDEPLDIPSAKDALR